LLVPLWYMPALVGLACLVCWSARSVPQNIGLLGCVHVSIFAYALAVAVKRSSEVYHNMSSMGVCHTEALGSHLNLIHFVYSYM